MCGGPGDGHEDLLDDRLRARAQPDAGDRRRGRVRRARRWPGSARSRRTSRRSSSSTAARCSPTASSCCRSRRARSSSSGRRARCWSTSAPTSSSTTRTSPARSRSRCSTPASAPGSPGSPTASRTSCSSAATTTTAATAGQLAVAVGVRRLAGFLRGGMTELAAGEAAGRADRAPAGRRAAGRERRRAGPRRARAQRVGRRPPPRLGPHAVARHRRRSPTGSTRARRSPSSAASGQRAAVAASLVRRAGAERVIHVVDGGVPQLLQAAARPRRRRADPVEQPPAASRGVSGTSCMRITESGSTRWPTSPRMRSAVRSVFRSMVSSVQVITCRPCAAGDLVG